MMSSSSVTMMMSSFNAGGFGAGGLLRVAEVLESTVVLLLGTALIEAFEPKKLFALAGLGSL